MTPNQLLTTDAALIFLCLATAGWFIWDGMKVLKGIKQ